MPTYSRSTFILLLTLVTGCESYGIFAKRESEFCCTTDIRQTVPWCAGEDAVFDCPCGPAGDFYGHKPTCWRTWPTPGAIWRDAYCAPPASYEVPAPEALPPVETAPLPTPELVQPPINGDRPAAPTTPLPRPEPPRLQKPAAPDRAARARPSNLSPTNPFRPSSTGG